MKITVGIPTRSTRPSIYDAIKSILNQTYKDFEILICDDSGEPDNPRIIALKEKYKDLPNFRVVHHKENLGIGEARQTIVDNVSKDSDYLTFLSSDDIWELNFLEVMAKTSLQHPDKILYSNYYLMDLDKNIIGKTKFMSYKDHGDFCIAALSAAEKNTMFVNFSTTFFPIKVFEKVQFNKDLRFGEDLDFLLKSMKHFEYHFVEDSLLQYQTVDNTTSRVRHKIGENNEKIMREVVEYWENG